MPPKKGVKRGPYKKTIAKQNAYKARMVKSRVFKKGQRKLSQSTVYRYSRWTANPTTLTCDTASVGINATFTLDDVKAYTDFTALYDQFKITTAIMYITLINNPNATFALGTTGNVNVNDAGAKINSSNFFPKLWYTYDNDDSSNPTLDQIRERQGVKYRTLMPNKPVKIVCKPCALVQTYRTATTTGYAPKRMFLDVATGQNVPHYAMKGVIDCMGIDPNDSYPFKIRVEIKYYLAFKGVL